MFKDPLDYTIENITEIMDIPIIIGTGKSVNFKELKGVIVGLGKISKSSTLPIFIRLEHSNGKLSSYNLFDVKYFKRDFSC